MVSRILDDSDRQAIDEALERQAEVQAEIVTARAAGLDVRALEERLNKLRERLTQIRSAYFPES